MSVVQKQKRNLSSYSQIRYLMKRLTSALDKRLKEGRPSKYCRLRRAEIRSSSIQSGDSGTTFWNTTSTFRTSPHRASAQQREHQPARVVVLVQLFGTPGPPTRPRATPYMVRVLVQPLEHQGHQPDRDSGPLFDESLRSPQEIIMSGPLFDESRPALGRGKK